MKRPSRNKASSLVTTLMVIVVLTIIVVAFMQSMSIERLTSRSYANKYQAELLADAATEDAINRIFTAVEPRPYSATYYSNIVNARETRHLYLARYFVQSNALSTERIPLFSTVFTNFSVFTNVNQPPIETAALSIADVTDSGSTMSRSLTSSNDIYTDFNRANSSYPNGFVGLTNTSGPMALPGNWIYQTNAQGKVVGRYAYWVDDETSKIDLRTASATTRGDGTKLNEISLKSFLPLGINAGQVTNLVNFKSQNFSGKSPAISRYALGTGTPITDDALWHVIRPFLTQYTLHDLRSPDGNLAVNLNNLIVSTNEASQIQTQIETIATAITNNFEYFGERFFQATGASSTATVPASTNPFESNPLTYVKKIAANIRDYIDTDNTATVLMEDGTAYTGVAPDFIPLQTAIIDDIPIVGKERGPFLNEFALVTRVISPNPEAATTSGSVNITVRFGHYIELFNPGPTDIVYADMGNNPRVIIANQTPWRDSGGGPALRPADIRIDLPSDIVIPAKGYAVLTTDGPPWNSANQSDYLGSASNRYLIRKGTGPGTWSLLGTGGQTTPSGAEFEDYNLAAVHNGADRYGFQLDPLENSYNGCRERLLFVNDDGIIDYTLRIYTVGNLYMGKLARNPTAFSTFVADGFTSGNNTNPEGSSTVARLTRGDPRSNTEISELAANSSCSWKSGNSPQYGNNMGSLQMTLGADNYQWATSIGTANIWRQAWAEYSAVGNHVVASGTMGSVGELGFIYDPARYNFTWYRSYGRTLRVGQPDAENINRNANSTAANDRNWIGGLGTNAVTSTNYLKNAFQLANIFRTDDFDYGKINPNGLYRSSNRVVQDALFYDYAFSPAGTFQSSGQLTGQTFNSNAVYNALRTEFASNRPFIGVGDLSRLEIFATSTNTNSVAVGQNMSVAAISDGDREEVYRRTVGLTSTQSLSYSVYVVGQSGKMLRDPSGNDYFKANSTVRKNTIVQFKPNYSSTDFPAKPASWTILKPWQINLN
jgi:hypothetical protein